MFEIQFTAGAAEDMRWLSKSERRSALRDLELQLRYEPDAEARNRKRLRPNQLAEWELRVGRFRIFYDIDRPKHLIKVLAVGYKVGSRLCIRGREYPI